MARRTLWIVLAALACFIATSAARFETPYLNSINSGGSSLYAVRPPDLFFRNVGLLQLLVMNIGVVGNPFGSDLYGAQW